MQAPDDAKAELMLKMKDITVPFYMGKFNKIAEANGKWLVGKNITWADVFIAHMITVGENRSKIPLAEGYPAVKKLLDDFYSVPLKKWISQRPQTE